MLSEIGTYYHRNINKYSVDMKLVRNDAKKNKVPVIPSELVSCIRCLAMMFSYRADRVGLHLSAPSEPLVYLMVLAWLLQS